MKSFNITFYFRNSRIVQAQAPIRFSILFILILSFALISNSCKKDLTEDPIIKPPVIRYMQIDLSSGNQVQINHKSTYSYELNTTGEDPYLFLKPLTMSNNPDSVIFTFEYQCPSSINEFQIFFASPITEERSVKTGAIPAAKSWSTYSVDLSTQIKQFRWGSIGDFLRLDFGSQSGITFNIRNMYMRGMNAVEKAIAQEKDRIIRNDLLLEFNLKKYFTSNYSSQISEVKVGTSSIIVNGNYSGSGEYALCEITPYDSLTQISKFSNKITLNSPSFAITFDRYVVRNGFKYDRLLSKWVIAKIGSQSDEIVSYAKFADQITPVQSMSAQYPSSKKGLGGYSVNRGFQSDLDDLNISSVTVNITPTSFMYSQPRANAIEHTYGDKTYYFDKAQVEELDRTMQTAYSKNIVVAAIILIQKASECADPEIGRLLQHPHYTSQGIFTMPNMSNPASVNCYAAALDFLASRYSRSDNHYGRIHHWIMHNEVDAGSDWTNMGEKPMLVYTDTYYKSMRMCYNIARMYDQNSQVFASFTHSWASAVGSKYYSTKDILNTLLSYSRCEGDFQWAIAYHPYPENLFEPKTWNDENATFSSSSPLVTFKNLEVINDWIKKSGNMYKGTIKRTLWLSENGTNSKTYSEQDLKEQAAGFAYAWKKIKNLDGIDGIQWHNWIDNRYEGGLRIGLRKFPDDTTDPGGRKPVWFLYQAAGTNQEDSAFDPYKSIIGIQSWSDIFHSVVNY